jgi:aspartate kinase
MKVFKFGGASISTLERIEQTVSILQAYQNEPLLIIISAMGKTTNALEKVVDAFYGGQRDQALQLFEQVKHQHLQTAKYLLVKQYLPTEQAMLNFFTEVEWLLYDQPVREYDYYYDQIVCVGELLATTLVSAYWNEKNCPNTWLDVRDILRTDAHFRDANIDWSTTTQKTKQQIEPLSRAGGLVVTQGFVGATDENESTTLGREGSDFSAAIFAHILEADELIIWKDVPAVMNADPKSFPNAVALPELHYEEVIEMAYYGAQVIHPKTIKPLQNKHIPLQVKSFLDPQAPGTRIHQRRINNLPPIIVKKENQVLLTFQSVDYSFVGEAPLAALYQLFAAENIRPNLTQNGAIRFLCCLDDKQSVLDTLIAAVAQWFDVQVERNLTLLTIRHGNEALASELVGGRQIVLEQASADTWQALLRG